MRAVEQAARIACADGLVWIDTAPNYGSAHQALGPVIADHPRAMVATKTGFFTPDEGTAALRSRVLTAARVRAGHSLDPGFVRWQTERSLAAIGRIELVFVHNPEHAGLCPTELHPALGDVVAVLEEFADAGGIGGYGVATWSGFQHDAFSVSELLGLAIEAAGSGEHHLRAVQQPVGFAMARPIALSLDGRARPSWPARGA
ncbi:aldo/keto reductase [Streptomyces sp. NPDC059917]|uniref:aldo/keto reductase n=1 Tax=Streptomyces sp. NPDC059917 TaxID=3347002 RepID=UPI003646A30F